MSEKKWKNISECRLLQFWLALRVNQLMAPQNFGIKFDGKSYRWLIETIAWYEAADHYFFLMWNKLKRLYNLTKYIKTSTYNTELNGSRKIICLRKSEIYVLKNQF